MSIVANAINNTASTDIGEIGRTYARLQNELLKLDTHYNLVRSTNTLNDDRIKKNENSINMIDSDLMTTRRQVEIIQNRNLIKEDIITLLRSLVLFASLALACLVLLKGKSYQRTVLYILIAYVIYYYGAKSLEFISKHNNRWTIYNFRAPTKPGVEGASFFIEQEDPCAAEEEAILAEERKIKNRMLDKIISIQSRIDKLTNSKKSLDTTAQNLKKKFDTTRTEAGALINKLPDTVKTDYEKKFKEREKNIDKLLSS